MNQFLIPFVAFVAVMLIILLLYGVWVTFFDRLNKAKKNRLQAIHNAVQWGGQSPSSLRTNLQDSELEAWLRSRSKAFIKLENLIQRAHSPISASRLLGLMLALFVAVLVLGLLLKTNPLLLPALALAISSAPVLWLHRKANQRRKALENKLPEALDYISRSLRAGHSLTTAIGAVGKEFPDPIGYEFKIVFDEISFGISFKESIGQLADRVQSNDVNFFVIALMIQHETGGNLTELLDGLAKTIRERFKLRGKIRTLSSEGRISALVLGSMPFLFTAMIAFINPGYISVLWTTPQGHTLLLIGGGLMLTGLVVLNKMVQIKV
ncbi:MAG: type II secretion system F family protein [Chlorobiaceae bacterium]|nr:type II secretion system F family protein [Chlorobiaceae bacterium]